MNVIASIESYLCKKPEMMLLVLELVCLGCLEMYPYIQFQYQKIWIKFLYIITYI